MNIDKIKELVRTSDDATIALINFLTDHMLDLADEQVEEYELLCGNQEAARYELNEMLGL